jgi:hypothetical protein
MDLGRDGLDPGDGLHGSPARYGASMAYDPATGNAVLFGGQDGLGRFLSDTWIFNRRTVCTKFGAACLASSGPR